MHAIDRLGFASRISQIDPRGKLAFSMLPLILCISFNSALISLFTIVVMACVTIHCNPQLKRNYLHYMLIPSGFLLVGTIGILINRYDASQPLLVGFYHGLYGYGISFSSLKTGGTLILRALSAVSCMYFLSFNTPMLSLFQMLRKTKLPNLIVSLMELIYHYIFVIWDEAARMRIAQHSRLGNCDFKTSIKSTGIMLSSLFIRAYQRCDRVYSALDSRGYTGSFEAVSEAYESGKDWYAYTALFCTLLLALGLIEKLV